MFIELTTDLDDVIFVNYNNILTIQEDTTFENTPDEYDEDGEVIGSTVEECLGTYIKFVDGNEIIVNESPEEIFDLIAKVSTKITKR